MKNQIIISDIHFRRNSRRSDPTKGKISSWLDTQFSILESIFEYAYNVSATTIVHNGDLFHDKNRIDVAIYNQVWEFFRKYSDTFDFIFNTGNHDLFLSDIKESSLKPFKAIGTVIYTDTLFRREDHYDFYIPYSRLNNITLESIFEHNIDQDVYLYIHSNIDMIDNNIFYDNLDPKLLNKYEQVFNGHIHNPKEFGNIVNVGSIMRHNFKEGGTDRRFIHLDSDMKIRSVPINCPEFYTIDSLDEISHDLLNKDNFNYYRINVYQSQVTNPIFSKFNVSTFNVKNDEREVRLKEVKNPTDELKEYIKLRDTDLSEKLLLKVGNSIMKEGDN